VSSRFTVESGRFASYTVVVAVVVRREGTVTAEMGPSGRVVARSHARRHAAPRGPSIALPAKFQPPRAHGRCLLRRALLADLAASHAPLVLLCAPPGTGKTTVLRQWVEADDRPTAWLQIDPGDDDPVILLMLLLRALGDVAPVDADIAASLSLAIPPLRERVLPRFAEALASAPPFLLVIDDAYLLRSPACWETLVLVMRDLPQGAQIALGTRNDPPLPLPRLRMAGELVEIRSQALALDLDELAEYVDLQGAGTDATTMCDLLALTEGWVAGVRLVCLAADGRPLHEWVPRIDRERDIAAYLTTEVLQGQSSDIQEFLLRTSVLNTLTPDLCQLVTGRADAGELLDEVVRRELFLVPLGAGHLYRYHHLFAVTLQEELGSRRPGEGARLHRRVAGWCAAHDDPDGQIRHLLAAGDVTAAADVVAGSWTRMWDRGMSETVCRWLESFDDRQVLAHKALTLTAGWVFTALDDGRMGERWGRAACASMMDDSASPDGAASLRSSQALLRATIAPDGVRRMREDAELAAQLETRPEVSWYADAQATLGVARWLSGSSRRALRPLAAAARVGSVTNPAAELAALGYLALIGIDEGEWEVAADYESRASARLDELGFGTSRRCLPMLLARVKLETRQRGVDGGAAAKVSELVSRMVPHLWMSLLVHVVMGEAAVERADPTAAEAHIAAAAAILKRYPDAGILGRRAERLRETLEGARIAEPPTPAERRVLELLPTCLPEAQIADSLCISRNTVKTHLRSLYRKLQASSRADAVERARRLGLLPPP
jgi:LuxR family maltose regulon positive regulatory protein